MKSWKLLFFSFLRSLGGSFNALMMRQAVEGWSSMVAARLATVNLTRIRSPLYSIEAFAISSCTFFAGTPRGPIFWANVVPAPSPPTARTKTNKWMEVFAYGSWFRLGWIWEAYLRSKNIYTDPGWTSNTEGVGHVIWFLITWSTSEID